MIKEIPNFLSDQECDYIIDLINSNNYRSSVSSQGTDRSEISDFRTSYSSSLSQNDGLVNAVKLKIAEKLNLPVQKGESLQGQKYDVNQYFKPHHDYFTGQSYDKHCLHSGNRTHTFMIYLNDNFEGGETDFSKLNKTVEPEKGKAVIWENMTDGKLNDFTLHEGTTVKSGTKYIITSWWREKEWDGKKDNDLYFKAPQTYTNKNQIPKFTETGFKVVKCPNDTWQLIKEVYSLLKDKKQTEFFDNKNTFIPTGGSDIYSFSHLESIKKIIHKQLIPIHKDFCNADIEPSAIYGIRSYTKGATLKSHVDRVETHHISSIIIVDKDLNGPDWPLDIQSHDGKWHKVYANIGDMILYESATCEHGRLEPLSGEFFNNFYVHYKLL